MMKPEIDTSHSVVMLIFLVALAARVATIWCGTNVDEGVYWVEGRQIRDGYMIYRDTQFNKPPLVCLTAAAFFLFGDTPILPMRLAMIAFSLLGLFAVYRLAKELFGPGAALAALVVMALEPYTCVWAKYLHTSSWAPWFEAAVFLLLISGLKQQARGRIMASGVALGVYALAKQSAIYVLPPALLAWFLFSRDLRLRRCVGDAFAWAGGILLVLVPFLGWIIFQGIFPHMWHDIWTAHYLMAPAFAHHTFAFRWGELRSMVHLAPLLWWLPFGSLLRLKTNHWRPLVFVWAWLIVDLWGNIFFLSHVWRHYFLVCMAPAAILSGVFWQWLADRVGTRLEKARGITAPSARLWAGTAILALGMVVWWPRNDWTYPGLSLSDEKKLAGYVERLCPEPFLLNLTNPALYVWTGKEIPPACRDGHTTRIPFFMTIAGRGYFDREDMERTVEGWRNMPIGCVVAYDKYVRQIMDDPVMEPLLGWLKEDFQSAKRIGVGDTYYGWFFLFERKRP